MDINAPIQYEWKLGWDKEGMSEPAPTVNLLLKAIIEKDVDRMEELFAQGAMLNKINKSTLERAVFHIMDDYQVVSCMVKHGFHGFFGPFEHFECVAPDAYIWHPLARAWYLGAYSVFELLAKFGFSNQLWFCIGGKVTYDVEKLIVAKNDLRAAKILLEYGYPRRSFEFLKNKYPDSIVIRYLDEHPVLNRKLLSLDNCRFKTIEKPQMEKPGLFNHKRVEKRNSDLMEDYMNRLEAQQNLRKLLGENNWKRVVKNTVLLDEAMTMIASDMVK